MGKTTIPPNSAIEVPASKVPPKKPVGRKTQFFLPGDGISREVIQGDICRYLDHDATVMPGDFEGTKGYFILAYRNLTSEMIKDIKLDSSKLDGERKEKVKEFKQTQAPSQANNKRKLEAQTQVAYADSKTHVQSVQRHEEREQQRILAESPAPGPPRGYPQSMPPIGNLPTPSPQRGDQTFPISPAQQMPPQQMPPQQMYTNNVPTPPSTISTPNNDTMSHYSGDGRASTDTRGSYGSADSYYRQDQSAQYAFAPPLPPPPSVPQQSQTGPTQTTNRPFQPPPPPIPPPPQQQMPSRPRQDPYSDYDDRTDTDMDTRMDPPRLESRMDTRMGPPEPPYGSRMDTRPDMMDARMDTRADSRMDSRSDYGPPRHDSRDMRDDRDYRDPRPDPRMEHRASTSVGMRDSRQPPMRDSRDGPRYDDRRDRDPRDSRDSRGYQNNRGYGKPYDDRRRGR